MVERGKQERKGVDGLTLLGLAAVTAMLVTYANEHRGPGWVLGFAASCLAGSAYGFLQGAWPFGMVEAVWAVVAARRWRRTKPWGPGAPNPLD
jgi:hypothetical protein